MAGPPDPYTVIVEAHTAAPVTAVQAGAPSSTNNANGPRRAARDQRVIAQQDTEGEPVQIRPGRASLIGVALAVILVSGCTTDPNAAESPASTPSSARPGVSPSAGDPSASVSPTPTPTPTPVGVDPTAGAAANDPVARAALEPLLADDPRPGGRAIVDALAAAGFDKAAMEVTADATPLGNPTDAVLFAVRLGEECLLGQVDGAGLTTSAQPVLGTGRCLVGATRSIDW